MLERLRTQIGTAGLVVAIVALVAALGGGAYAATGGSGGGKATASAKQGKQGKPGKPGKTGPAGPAGPQGPTGPTGAKGDVGPAGSNGSNGAPGQSVTGTPIAVGSTECASKAGGVKYTLSATSTNVCNGEKGKQGEPWTAGGTLPEGATETGIWGTAAASPTGQKFFDISFPLPTSAVPTPILVLPNEESKAGCPGRGGGPFPPGHSPGIPQADPGNLCVYLMASSNATAPTFTKYEFSEEFEEWEPVPGASQTGTVLTSNCSGLCFIGGTWAVTGPE